MALEATHVRFALALQSRLEIRDLIAYCSGAVYPDTRYVTGLDRESTHGADSPHDPFADGLTDFERGWASHVLYDEIEGAAMKTLIPSTMGVLGKDIAVWIELTAMKIVEDMMSVRVMGDDIRLLRELAIDESPRGEHAERIRKYLRLTSELYEADCTLDDYATWIREVGGSDDNAVAMRQRTKLLLTDKEMVKKIEGIFDDVVERSLHRS